MPACAVLLSRWGLMGLNAPGKGIASCDQAETKSSSSGRCQSMKLADGQARLHLAEVVSEGRSMRVGAQQADGRPEAIPPKVGPVIQHLRASRRVRPLPPSNRVLFAVWAAARLAVAAALAVAHHAHIDVGAQRHRAHAGCCHQQAPSAHKWIVHEAAAAHLPGSRTASEHVLRVASITVHRLEHHQPVRAALEYCHCDHFA